jgi:uncharacterized protein YdcH (DUF465 family)
MMTREKLTNHIQSLQEKHRELDKEITERDCHWDEYSQCEELKKRRLKLKDEIELCKKRLQYL